MNKKYKIIMMSDHPLATSGVAVAARVLIEGLIKTGKYSFKCLGAAIKHLNYNTTVVNQDFIIKPVNGFGTKENIKQILLTERPDAVLIFTDPRQFGFVWEMEDEIHQLCPIVYWHVWDNDPYPKYNEIWYESTDLINCISAKTYELIKPYFPDKTNYIPHAFPNELYHRLPNDQIKTIRKQHFGPRADWQIGLWVNRNATRKMPNDLLECFKNHLDNLQKKYGHKNALLIMHTDPTDPEGPALLAVVEMLGIQNKVWFSTQKLDFKDMNILHNITDYVVNISKAEGFGLSTMIGLKTGKPIIALKTGGMTRQVIDWRDGTTHGVAIDPIVRMLVGSQLTPYIYDDHVDKNALTKAFMTIHSMTERQKEDLAKKNIEYANFEFNYEKMINDWDVSLEKCITEYKKNKPKSWTIEKIENFQQKFIEEPVTAQLIHQFKPSQYNKVALNSDNNTPKQKINLDDIIGVRSSKPKEKKK
jgi:glycosyltransferase involved in cell wall biosynthesis